MGSFVAGGGDPLAVDRRSDAKAGGREKIGSWY